MINKLRLLAIVVAVGLSAVVFVQQPTSQPAMAIESQREAFIVADFTLQALKDELDNDPESLGYAAAGWPTGVDQDVADVINSQDYTIDKRMLLSSQLTENLTFDAYDTLSIDEQEYFRSILIPTAADFTGNGLPVTADVKLQLTGLSLTSNGTAGTGNPNTSWWATAHRTEMVNNYTALIEIAGSRAEVLWGEGTVISASQIGQAANLP